MGHKILNDACSSTLYECVVHAHEKLKLDTVANFNNELPPETARVVMYFHCILICICFYQTMKIFIHQSMVDKLNTNEFVSVVYISLRTGKEAECRIYGQWVNVCPILAVYEILKECGGRFAVYNAISDCLNHVSFRRCSQSCRKRPK